MYIFGRLILGFPLLFRTWMCPSDHIIVSLMCTGIFIQSVNFTITMIQILKSRAREYAERKQKNVKMKWFEPLTKDELDKIEIYKKKQNAKQYIP
jgi:hypothetical protein